MKEKDLLTVFLPIKEGSAFTVRFMEYLNEVHFPFKLVIADGGNDDDLFKLLSSKDNFRNVRYEYIKCPYDEDYPHFYKKMLSNISNVKTPYISILDNDCLPVLDGLIESLKFLENNTEYSTCRGQHIDYILSSDMSNNEIRLRGDKILVDPSYFDKDDSIWCSFEESSPEKRILDWSHTMNITYFNIHKTEVIQELWKFISSVEFIDLCLIDITKTLYALVEGKAKVLDIPFTMRQQNSSSSVSKDMISRSDILDRMLIGKWTNDLNDIIKNVSQKIISKNKPTGLDVEESIRLSLKNHYADRLFSHLKIRDSHLRDNEQSVSTKKANVKHKVIASVSDADSNLAPIVRFLLNK